MATQRIVFSDLDGTLLDHDDYSWQAAAPALEALRERQVPLVLVTSKTRAEVIALREEMDNTHPFIVENGAATLIPEGYFNSTGTANHPESLRTECHGPSRDELRTALGTLAGQYLFASFTDLGPAGIARHTGLSLRDAVRANERLASEPVLWQDSDQALGRFSRQLGEHGLCCLHGGRFVHVMGNFDKAAAVGVLIPQFRERFAPVKIQTIALGDGPNDLAMLRLVDIAVIVKARHQHRMRPESSGRVIYTERPGPEGWREAILELLNEHRTES